MNNNLQLYHKVLHQLCQWLPGERVTRQRNLALLITGLYLSASVQLPFIVRKWHLRGKELSLVNRLHRFLSNRHFSARAWYEPVAAQLVAALGGQTIRLVIDVTKVGFNHRTLVVGLAYRKRTLPLAWSVHKGKRGNVAVSQQVALLRRVYRLIPHDCPVHLVGDCGFCTSDLLHWLTDHQWHYVIRQPGKTHVRLASGEWRRLSHFPLPEGQTWVIGWVWLAKTNPFGPAWLLLHWEPGEDEPWYLVSDHPGAKKLPRAYKRRMWMEEMFGDMKGHGFDLEATHLRQAVRIERLMLAVCIAFVCLLTLGCWVVKRGLRHFIDHKSRRDKSYFRLGWDWIERCLRLNEPYRLHFRPYL